MSATRPNSVLPGPPYAHFDTEGHWGFFQAALERLHQDFGVDAISITTHGACAALLEAFGALAAPVIDDEEPARRLAMRPAKVTVSIDPAQVHLFDPVCGVRLSS